MQVSNISDFGWLGIHRTLIVMVPLLQTHIENPHATLITLFMNAVAETMTDQDRKSDSSIAMKRLLQYLPMMALLTSTYDPEVIKLLIAKDIVAPSDHIFGR